MKTSPTTSKTGVRAALLDVLHAQWREFGVPFNAILPGVALRSSTPRNSCGARSNSHRKSPALPREFGHG